MVDKDNSRRVLSLCDQVLALPPAERHEFLSDACGEDSRLRASVDSVLIAVDSSGEFLQSATGSISGGVDMSGRIIGHYEIGECLGEGGMGSVYRATRHEDDYDQQVAIKFVHGHMLGREFVERFNAERKILAALNHPYIAALIDSGITPEGLPFIVMEFVDGLAIDDYCNIHQLNLSARIGLIQKTAMAVQAAHQNLIVHRDLKPANVLITADGIPKLLDFGIAKLIQPLDEAGHGNTTVFGRQAMTPDYASPEQILKNVVTTASDVYSLGILTYQLLVGERPYHIPTTSHLEMVRTVETMTVIRPSTRLSGIAEADLREQIATERATSFESLRKNLQGDIDNILLKALDQDPQRRYSSVTQFAEDLDRFLKHLPVSAHADSAGYRVGKFLQRHWIPTSAAALLVVTLTGGIVAYALQAKEAQTQRGIALEQAQNARRTVSFMKDMLFVGDPFTSGDSGQTVADVLEYAEQHLENQYLDQPGTRATILTALSEIHASRGDYARSKKLSDAALAIFEQSLGTRSNDAANAYRVNALAHYYLDEYEKADELFSRALDIFISLNEPDWASLTRAYDQMGMVQGNLTDENTALKYYNLALSTYREHKLNNPSQLLTIYNNLGAEYLQKGDYQSADSALLEGIKVGRDGGVGEAQTGVLLANRAGALKNLGRFEEAAEHYVKAADLLEASLGLEHPETITTLTSLANLYRQMGNMALAEKTILKANDAALTSLPAEHFLTSYVQNVGGAVLCMGGDIPLGTSMARASLETRQQLLPADHWAISSGEGIVGLCLTAAGEFQQAEPILLRAYTDLRASRGDEHEVTLATRERLYRLYTAWGRPGEATKYKND